MDGFKYLFNSKMPSCSHCLKKTVIPFTCHCANVYCLKHRIPEVHNCTFDFKAAGKLELTEKNPKMIYPKISKI